MSENRSGQYTFTPYNTVCDDPEIGCHKYRLFASSLPQRGTLIILAGA
ncbi:hypothetical protein ACSVDA_19560 [Cytobacillus sp. Hm23]